MKFKDAPIGARFMFIEANTPKDVYVKIHANGDGLVVKWNGNVEGYQTHENAGIRRCFREQKQDSDGKLYNNMQLKVCDKCGKKKYITIG